MLVGLQSDEFSYVKPGLLRNWAGLQSWSYRVQSHGVKEGKSKGMRKKEDFILMFDDMTDEEITASLAQSKVSTTLAASDAKPSGAPFLLPDDIHFKADSLTSMSVKFACRICKHYPHLQLSLRQVYSPPLQNHKSRHLR